MGVLVKCRCGCLVPRHATTPQTAQATPAATTQTTPTVTSQTAQATPSATSQTAQVTPTTTSQTTPATSLQAAYTVTPGSTKPLISFDDEEGSVSTRTRSKSGAAKKLSL